MVSLFDSEYNLCSGFTHVSWLLLKELINAAEHGDLARAYCLLARPNFDKNFVDEVFD